MYLKSLKLAGFKSFADRTRLEFRPGVTVVVGPNGSGKSNLVDALSWVVGTQSTKALRTQKMEDVIFAGTATRPSLGKAEATLVVDNTERLIDLDLDEVSITRRLYRDGSSDYELNGVGCRLLDIQDLLSDSGVGRHQHVIIGQGEIGRVLNASPEEHRAVIEEAAGILKHRRRKERSERRLARTDEDLIRLQDLLGEINRQMRPLRRQARAAERYEGLKSQVIALRLYLGGRELESLSRELTIATSEKSVMTEGLEVDQKRVQDLGGRLTELGERADALAAHLDRDTSSAALLETTNERLRRIASIALERGRAASGRLEVAVERRLDLEQEQDDIAKELAVIETDRGEAESLARASEARFRRLEDEERAIATQTALSPEGALAAVRGELSAKESSLARDNREIEHVTHRAEVLAAQSEEERQGIERINDEIRSMDAAIGQLQEDYDTASRSRAQLQERWSTAENSLDGARIDLAAARARLDAISTAMAGRNDADSLRVASEASGVLGPLTAQLDVPEGLEVAVAAALDVWVDAVAFTDPHSLRETVEVVKGRDGGSISLVSSMSETATPAVEAARILGLQALIDRLGPGRHQGLASRLLGDVVLVQDWTTGWDVIAKHPALRAVTFEGDLISVSGVRIGDPEDIGSAMLKTAATDVERASTSLARAESIHTAARRDFDASRDLERRALENLEQVESSLAGHSEAMLRMQNSLRGLQAEQARLDERRAALDEAIEAATDEIDVLRARLQSLEGEEAERLRAWEELEASRVRVAADREAARSRWQDAAAALRAVVERERLLVDRQSRICEELDRLGRGIDTGVDHERLERVGQFARMAISILERRIEELRKRQLSLRDQTDDVRRSLEEVGTDHETRTRAIARARERVAEIDVLLTELRMKKESVVEAIRRDADSDVEDAINAPRPDLEEGADPEELMESLVAQLRRLGPINPLAAQEYRDLEERHQFLSDQMADVETSRAELRKVISALESEIQNRFDGAFTEISQAYEKYFAVLFPGGRGRLRLVDDGDPQSGVSIDAQPMGKRITQMTLLSGGERSLAALAFLFAIFEARPSPFYVLDEVEAALDDTNLRRFLRLVEEFRKRAQLIIVTHQQQTMEAADVLYGVTMEPGGASQAIRKDMHAALTVDRVA